MDNNTTPPEDDPLELETLSPSLDYIRALRRDNQNLRHQLKAANDRHLMAEHKAQYFKMWAMNLEQFLHTCMGSITIH